MSRHLPYPPGATERTQIQNWITVSMIPTPEGMKGIGLVDGKEEEIKIACLLLQEFRSTRMGWMMGDAAKYTDHLYEPPYETRIVPGYVQSETGDIWEDESITVSFE